MKDSLLLNINLYSELTHLIDTGHDLEVVALCEEVLTYSHNQRLDKNFEYLLNKLSDAEFVKGLDPELVSEIKTKVYKYSDNKYEIHEGGEPSEGSKKRDKMIKDFFPVTSFEEDTKKPNYTYMNGGTYREPVTKIEYDNQGQPDVEYKITFVNPTCNLDPNDSTCSSCEG